MICDAHAHLDEEEYGDDVPEIVDRAKAAGLKRILVVGMLGHDVDKAADLVSRENFMHLAVGVHPHDADKVGPDWEKELNYWLDQPKTVGLGEIGLDFFRDWSPKADQERMFVRQLHLARERDLPVIIHDREAHRETMDFIRSEGAGLRGMFHCFSGDVDLARQVLDLGFYISIPGPVTFPKADVTRAAAAYVPLDRLLVETDCPYLTPVPHRGKRNEPAYVVHTAEFIAQLRGDDYQEFARATTTNLETLFGLGDKVC